ncbi:MULTISPECIES: GDSL-type esterase/lipase family protein [Nocardiopsis]|uniref:GDSL family lipase n=1 Tax=Nocardiopsis sinuspersici TaxID=501010 RepID=A0A1V3BV52_9ACTN|nr:MULTISPECIES: GDSL-type esterase/lipase family protein [Nocardiopsis]OOC52557.1 GDSL family lipase [Nocardiopsis sinuspersici]
MTIPRRRRTGLLVLAGVLSLVLVAAGSVYWTAVRAEGGPDTEAEAPVKTHRIMLAGDSMTQGANGDRTWRYHLWNHLSPQVEGVDFVGPYTDPASRNMIFPVPTTEHEEAPSPSEDPAEGYQEDGAADPSAGGPEPGGTVPAEGPEGPGDVVWPGTDGDPDTAEYRDPDFDQQHNALWGRTLRDAAASIQEEVRVHEPDVLCVMLGVNDLLWPVGVDEMEYRLRDYVESARKGNPNLRVVLAEAPPIALADSDEGFALRLYAYNMLVREVAADMSTEESPVTSLDIAGSEDWDVSGDTYDGTHPDAGGEVKIAAAFADALAAAYGIGEPYPRPLSSSPAETAGG